MLLSRIFLKERQFIKNVWNKPVETGFFIPFSFSRPSYILSVLSMHQKVKNYVTRIDADVDGLLLNTRGISYAISSDDVGGMPLDMAMAFGGVCLSVDKKDVEIVRELLDR